ncbi:LuxR family transcriptional regulator [Rhodococcus olei]|uniref:LuxR family transcriptional regulator n=1 Tax=Rhodococcus olei TaxID=2161675 RepID=A0ABP8PNA3_9NOCA
MFVGRDRELAELDQLLDEASTGTPVLALVEGPSGIGKSALVEQFVGRLDGWAIHAATGVSWEAAHPWGVAEQLLRSPVSATDPVDVAHDLLARTVTPTVLVVDDAHLSDSVSLQALVSAVRRAHARALLVLLVVPDVLGEDVDPATRRLLVGLRPPSVSVGPVDVETITRLALGKLGADLEAWTARRLAEHTGGNPRAVLQLLEEVPRHRWLGWQARFPAPRELAATVARTLAACPPGTRALVEAVAVLGDDCSSSRAAALAGLDDPVAALDSAHRAGLLVIRSQLGDVTLAFPDPMTAVAVADGIGPARWSELHTQAAAIAEDTGAALFHLVSATMTDDAELADRLEGYADSRAADGAWSDVARALITASRITPEHGVRAGRLLRGVDALTGAADLPQALTFLPEIENLPASPKRDAVLGYLAIQRGRPAEAHQFLTRAWESGDDDPSVAALVCQRMVLHSLCRLRGGELVEWADRARALAGEATPAAVEAAAIRGLGLGMSGSAESRTFYTDLPGYMRLGAQGQRVRMAEGWLALALDDPDTARTELESAEPTEFRGGSLRISLWAQAWLARTQFALGAWDETIRTVDRAAALLELSGLDLVRPLVHWTGAQVHALRGNWTAARRHLRRGRAGGNDYPIMLVPSCLAAAQCAEVAADYDGVLRHLEPLVALRDQDALDEPGFWPWPDLYANALVITGQVDRADEFLVPHEARATERGHRSAMARLGYVRGRILGARGDIAAARETFEGALSHLAALPLPYDRARVNYAYGQTLRRAGRRREADAVIRTARELYATLGAAAYVARCDRELKAGGVRTAEPAPDRPTSDVGSLTPQERAVATLVAAGKSNKAVAGELFLSVKTVQYHLTRIYAKLGIRSRGELAARFREHD